MKLAKINKNYRRLIGFFSILLLSLLSFAVVLHPVTSAANLGDRSLEYGYFYNQYVGGRGWHDVITGGIPNTADKATYINFLTNKFYNGTQQEKTGASFIINLQLGRAGSGSTKVLPASDINYWSTLINQPQVSFSVENYSFTYNSAYDTSTDDDLFYFDPDTRLSLVIRFNGAIVSVIKIDCANPLDGNPGIPNGGGSNPATLEGFVLEENTGNQLPANTTVSGVGTAANTGVFRFNSAAPGYSPDVPAGWHDVWVDNIPSGYSVVGSTLCGGSSPCGPGQPTSSTSGQNYAPGNFRTINFDPDSHHHLRWILRKNLALSCIPPTVTPGVVEPSTSYSVQVGVNVQPAAFAAAYAAGATATVRVTGPGVNSSNTVPVSASGTVVRGTVSPGPTNNTGVYTITFTITGPLGSITCDTAISPGNTFSVGYHPYFRVDAGDVTAGAGFTKPDGTCTASTAAQIRGSNTGAGGTPAFLGAGAQLGALALGTISNFPTSTNEGGGSSGVGAATRIGLTFANIPTMGDFGSLPCTPDYATEALTTATSVTPLGTGSYDLATLASGTYQVASGNVTLSGNIPQGRKVTIVVMGGTAIIDGDITYGGYAGLSDAPQFKLIVANGGNIKIKNDVTELHGVYMALPNASGTGGELSTCYNVLTGADSVDYTTCNHKLTFYGAVVVNTLLLERTYGSVSSGGGSPREPAETFNNSPELWGAPGPGTAAAATEPYDSIVSLPPVL